MTNQDYQIEAKKTLSCNYNAIRTRFYSEKIIDGFHGAVGICTEGGELLDAYKKHLFYGKDLDTANILEECGDILFYLNAILTAHGFTFDQAMETNIKKLKARYKGGSFSNPNAINRDLKAEEDILSRGANGTLYLTREDFNPAKVVDPESPNLDSFKQDLSKYGDVLYMSPTGKDLVLKDSNDYRGN